MEIVRQRQGYLRHCPFRKEDIMAGRVTIQDIADALGVSRNTVSKAINNTGILADSTREKVLKKAVEMGYKQFPGADTDRRTGAELLPAGQSGQIALLTTGFAGNSNYISIMLDRFQGEFSRWGYGFIMHRVREEDEENLRLPSSFDREKVSGIICIEMLDNEYCAMLCSLNIPILFVDAPVTGMAEPLKADYIYPDNQSAVYAFIREMAGRGRKQIGFIGEYMHCQSFFERYMGYRNALYLMNLPCREEYCITGNLEGVRKPDGTAYQEYLMGRLSQLKVLPEVMICANDYVAFDTLCVFKKLGISVPRDVRLCGFDDTIESKIITPSLTTVHICSDVMGESAAYLLMSRIKEPTLNYRTIHVQASPVYRESTGAV